MTDIVRFKVLVGTGCSGCHYAIDTAPGCDHPDILNRKCSQLDNRRVHEIIYLTEEQAALARLRGTYL